MFSNQALRISEFGIGQIYPGDNKSLGVVAARLDLMLKVSCTTTRIVELSIFKANRIEKNLAHIHRNPLLKDVL